MVGILVNLIVFPFVFLLVELFRRSRRYVERKEKISKVLIENGIIQTKDIKLKIIK
jgi:hypothetical protein